LGMTCIAPRYVSECTLTCVGVTFLVIVILSRTFNHLLTFLVAGEVVFGSGP
jgi:hypothetical protein